MYSYRKQLTQFRIQLQFPFLKFLYCNRENEDLILLDVYFKSFEMGHKGDRQFSRIKPLFWLYIAVLKTFYSYWKENLPIYQKKFENPSLKKNTHILTLSEFKTSLLDLIIVPFHVTSVRSDVTVHFTAAINFSKKASKGKIGHHIITFKMPICGVFGCSNHQSVNKEYSFFNIQRQIKNQGYETLKLARKDGRERPAAAENRTKELNSRKVWAYSTVWSYVLVCSMRLYVIK